MKKLEIYVLKLIDVKISSQLVQISYAHILTKIKICSKEKKWT